MASPGPLRVVLDAFGTLGYYCSITTPDPGARGELRMTSIDDILFRTAGTSASDGIGASTERVGGFGDM